MTKLTNYENYDHSVMNAIHIKYDQNTKNSIRKKMLLSIKNKTKT